ncbi:MAG: hypothetical protein ABL927_14315, partial [Bdellovibrionales bacterium]
VIKYFRKPAGHLACGYFIIMILFVMSKMTMITRLLEVFLARIDYFSAMKYRIILAITIGLSLLVYSCTKENYETKFKVVVGPCDSITFSKHIKPIIDLQCASASGCHEGNSSNGDFTAYDLMAPKISKFNQRVLITKDMPKGGALSVDQLSMITCWLDKGAKND